MPDRLPAAYAAVDLGASSGRVMLGSVERDAEGARRVRMTEVHRFANGPHPDSLASGAMLRWDVDRLFEETLTGLAAAVRAAAAEGRELAGIGVDSWGVDYAILPPAGPPAAGGVADPSSSAEVAQTSPTLAPSPQTSPTRATPSPAEQTPPRQAGVMRSPSTPPRLPSVDHHRGADPAGPADAEPAVSAARAYAVSGIPPQPINTSYRLRADAARRASAPGARIFRAEAAPEASTHDGELMHADAARHASSPGGGIPRAGADSTVAAPSPDGGIPRAGADSTPTAPWPAGGTVLLVPDLWVHLLSGATAAERTIASTTQLLDARTGHWSAELVDALGLGDLTLPETVAPGSRAGVTLPWVTERIGAAHSVPVFHVAEHDTASALAFAVPDDGELLVSSGSWSLAGLSLSAPVLTEQALAAGLTNERGVGESTLVLRNLAGLWLLVECTRQWSLEAGRMLDPVDLVREAAEHPELSAPVFDVGDGRLLAPGDMPERIGRLCVEAGQRAPEGMLGTVRSIVESLATAYAESVGVLSAATGVPVRSVRVVGGGSRNELLCRRTAELTGLPVVAGPAEASAFGNLAVQLVAAGEFASLAEVYAAGGEAGGAIARYDPTVAREEGSPV